MAGSLRGGRDRRSSQRRSCRVGRPWREDPLRYCPPIRAQAGPRVEGDGRRGHRPGPTWPRCAADPIAGAFTREAPGSLGAGKCGGRAPSGRSAGQCSGPGSPRRPATSGRALSAASPLPAAPPPRQAPQARPGRELTSGEVGAEVTHTLGISQPAGVRPGSTRCPEPPFSNGSGSGPTFSFSLGDPSDTHACAVKSGARRVQPR